jgi:hypothetical protein
VGFVAFSAAAGPTFIVGVVIGPGGNPCPDASAAIPTAVTIPAQIHFFFISFLRSFYSTPVSALRFSCHAGLRQKNSFCNLYLADRTAGDFESNRAPIQRRNRKHLMGGSKSPS